MGGTGKEDSSCGSDVIDFLFFVFLLISLSGPCTELQNMQFVQ